MNHRICVIGNSGSGKSTLSTALGEALKVPVIYLDIELFHENLKKRSFPDRKKIHRKLIQEDEWIIDGYYKNLFPERIKRATLVVFLNIPNVLSFGRVFSRYIKNNHAGARVKDGQIIKPTWDLLRWVVFFSRKRNIQYVKKLNTNNVPILILGPAQVDVWRDQVVNFLAGTNQL